MTTFELMEYAATGQHAYAEEASSTPPTTILIDETALLPTPHVYSNAQKQSRLR